MAEQLPFSCLCKAVVEEKKKKKKRKKKVWRERERTCTQNGEDRIIKIQELVYSRPNLIGSISTFGCMLQFCIFFFLSPTCVCIQCRQKVKLDNASVPSSIIVEHRREKESAIILCVFSLVLAFVNGYIFVCIGIFLYVCVHQGVHTCVTVSMCRWGVGVNCVLVCRRLWMLSRLQLGTAMVMSSAENGKSKPPTS